MINKYSKDDAKPTPVYNGALVREMSSRNGEMLPGLVTEVMKVYQGTMGQPDRRGQICSPRGLYFAQMMGAICQEELTKGHDVSKNTFVNLFELHGVTGENATKRMDDLERASSEIAARSGFVHLKNREFFRDYGAFLAQSYGQMDFHIPLQDEQGTMRNVDEWVTDARNQIESAREPEHDGMRRFFEYQNMLQAEHQEVDLEEQPAVSLDSSEENIMHEEESVETMETEAVETIKEEEESFPHVNTQDEEYEQMRVDAAAKGIFIPALEKLKGSVSSVYTCLKDAIEKNKENRRTRMLQEPSALSKYMTIMANGVMTHKGKFAVGMLLATGGNLPATALALGAAKYIGSRAIRKKCNALKYKDQLVTEGLKSAIEDLGWSAETAEETLSKFAGDDNREQRAELLQTLSEAVLNQTSKTIQVGHDASAQEDVVDSQNDFDSQEAEQYKDDFDLHGVEQRAAYEENLINVGGYAQDRVDEMLVQFDALKSDSERDDCIMQECNFQEKNPNLCEQNAFARIDEVRNAIVEKYGAKPELCAQQLLALGKGQTMRFDGKLADINIEDVDENEYAAAIDFAETRYIDGLELSERWPSMREQYLNNLQNKRMESPLKVSDKMMAFDEMEGYEQEETFQRSLEDMPEKSVLALRYDLRRKETLTNIYERFGPTRETAARMEEFMRTNQCTYDMDKPTTFTCDEMSLVTRKKAINRMGVIERDYLSRQTQDAEPVREFSSETNQNEPVVPDCTGNTMDVGGIPDATGDEYSTQKHKVQVSTAVLQNGDTEDDAAYSNMAHQLEENTDTASVPIIDELALKDVSGAGFEL